MKNNFSKYNLILCELHYTPLHGKTESSNPNIESHYLVVDRFNGITGNSLNNRGDDDDDDDSITATIQDDDEYSDDDDDNEGDNEGDNDNDNDNESNIIKYMKFYNKEYNSLRINKPHLLIRNYDNIIKKPNYIKPEIAQCIKLPTLEIIAVIKTIWIKIIQRKWKNICKKI
jgi:hypothetical protein